MYSSFHCADRGDICGFNAEKLLMMVAFFVQGLHRGLMTLLHNHPSCHLTYRPCPKCLNQGKKQFGTQFSILNKETTLQLCGILSRSRLNVAIQTRPYPEIHCIISGGIMLSPRSGPCATNHMNCFLIAFKRRNRNCCWVVRNESCILEMTARMIVIDVVCEVGKSLETPSNVIL